MDVRIKFNECSIYIYFVEFEYSFITSLFHINKNDNSQVFPITEKIHNGVLSLPISTVMEKEDMSVINIINNLKFNKNHE